ncbi:hypothetical protein NCS52_01573600 [Fusarium sp. LHS14.1]|nr:hypothetical protein NCS52_01573600 [Fusarium sp. LHS14.1]
MALDTLQNQLQNLNLVDPEFLPFSPTEAAKRQHGTFDDVPRYLFRVFTPKSQGITDTSWTKSMDARYGAKNSWVDVFSRADQKHTAQMLHRHLQWWEGPDDNLVSWTSSLLFALTYIFHLRANTRDRSTFGNIYLCVIDTSSFPDGAFVRDMDLIRFYRSADEGLREFERLRSRKRVGFTGYYYFGEYLSQGALKIEGKCQIVSARDIIDKGLYDIRSEFREFANWEPKLRPPWAKPVIELRETLYNKTERSGITGKGLQAAFNISQLFEPNWRLPIVASLIALGPPRTNDEEVLLAFRKSIFTGHNRENCSPWRTKMIVYDTPPEVQEYSVIMQSIHRDYCLRKLKESLGKAESSLRQTIMLS